MNKAAFHSAGWLDIVMFINRFRIQRFVFTADDLPFSVTSFQWQLVIKDNEGAINNLLSLSIGSGLRFPIYETNVIEARFETSQTNIQQGQKYWALIRTDTNEIWLNGHATFGYGPFDSSGSDQDVTVNVTTNTIQVELQAIVQVTETGSGSGGGGASLTDWPIASGAPTGTIAKGARYYLTGAAGVVLGEAVAEGTVMEARIANPTVRADWYFNMGGS